jgi:hypothetical protein
MIGANRVRVAWVTWAGSLALALGAAILFVVNRQQPDLIAVTRWLPGVADTVLYASVGTVIAWRRPENAIGWLLCFEGLGSGFEQFSEQYVRYTLVTHPGSLPAGNVLALAASLIMISLWFNLFTFLLLLFPGGRPLSTRWRPLIWITAAIILAATLDAAIMPGPIDAPFEYITNPIGADGPPVLLDIVRLIREVLTLCLLLLAVASVVSLILRIHRSRGIERQQLKWFVYVAAVAITSFIASGFVSSFVPTRAGTVVGNGVTSISATVLELGIPLVVGLAVLRYRLYDIDRIINKTLVYGSLTAIIVGADVLLVIGLEHLLEPVASGSDLVVAGSTLAVAALVRPLRSRIQTLVDRRFYRRKYDAARTLEAFSTRLRDQTDLAALATELGGVVQETMQPTQVSLWVCGFARGSGAQPDGRVAR